MRTAAGFLVGLVAAVVLLLVLLPEDPENGPTTSEPPPPVTSPTTEPPPAGPARLSVLSSPSGATVEVGLKAIDGVVTSGTGRVVGVTPIIDLQLTDADVSYGASFTNLYVEVRLDGYVPFLQTFPLTDSGLEANRTYEINVGLNMP